MSVNKNKHPFRKNWWSHFCEKRNKLIWKHKQYMHCDECGHFNGKTEITRKTI